MAVPQRNIKDRLLTAMQNNSIYAPKMLEDNIFQSNNIQNILAPTLRQIAIKHLELATTSAARSFRGEHLPISKATHQQYLQKQTQNGAWGTEIEAVALGAALQVNIVVTSVYNDRSDSTWCLHLEDENAPTIHLYNYNNIHWTNSNSNLTQKDGNCLFNAIAEGLQELETPTTHKTPLNTNSMFKYGSTEKETIKKQTLINKAIASAIKNQQSPAEKEMAFLREEERIRQLPDSEKEQISKDYAYALQLAREDMQALQIDIEESTIQNKFG